MVMTAEIVVMNKEAVVLAADSAVTSQLGEREKISTEANKLFCLSNDSPVGIMIFGNSSFMDIPWETIIKLYRKKNGNKKFPDIDGYADAFLSFLVSSNFVIDENDEKYYVDGFIFSFLAKLDGRIRKGIRIEIEESEGIAEDRISVLTEEIIKQFGDEIKEGEVVVPLKKCKELLSKYNKEVNSVREIIKDYLKPFNLSRSSITKINNLIINQLQRMFMDIASGVVVAGFGEDEIIPSVKAYQIEGIIGGKLKYIYDEQHSIQNKRLNGAVIPFAQDEMVHGFMTGVNPLFMENVIGYVQGLCADYTDKIIGVIDRYDEDDKKIIREDLKSYTDKRIDEFVDYAKQFAEEQFVNPVVDAVSRLPKSELAVLAESLVHLTSIKRKMSPEAETVAEPIDVAIISKGDGFVWIKRKHYFKAEINPSFFLRSIKELVNEYEFKDKE